jgi:hypothetical protein
MEITKDYLISKGFTIESHCEYLKKILSYTYTGFWDEKITKELEIFISIEDGEVIVRLDSCCEQKNYDFDCTSIKLFHIQTQKQLEDLYLILSNKPL